jgi:hypothetical protein
VRSAVTEWHAESLRIAHHRVRAHFSGGREQRERHEIARNRDQQSRRVRLVHDRPEIHHGAVVVGILQQQTEGVVQRELGGRPDLETDVERLGAAAYDVNRLRKAAVGHEKHALLPRRCLLRLQPVKHRHRFGRRGTLIEERCRRNVHARQVLDHGLEIQERLEPALGNLRLVRCVGCVPAGILEHVPQDHAGRHTVVIAHPDKRTRDRVALGDRGKAAEICVLAVGFGEIQRCRAADTRGNCLVDQRLERRHPDTPQHDVARRRIGTDVPGFKWEFR